MEASHLETEETRSFSCALLSALVFLVSRSIVCRLSFDRGQNGTIEKSELVDALKGMFPVEPGALEEVIEMNWRNWDADNNGTLGTLHFITARGGGLEQPSAGAGTIGRWWNKRTRPGSAFLSGRRNGSAFIGVGVSTHRFLLLCISFRYCGPCRHGVVSILTWGGRGILPFYLCRRERVSRPPGPVPGAIDREHEAAHHTRPAGPEGSAVGVVQTLGRGAARESGVQGRGLLIVCYKGPKKRPLCRCCVEGSTAVRNSIPQTALRFRREVGALLDWMQSCCGCFATRSLQTLSQYVCE